MSGVSVAFAEAVETIGHVYGQKPLPAGVTTVDAGDWTLSVNNGREAVEGPNGEIGPFSVVATNNKYFAVACFDPTGGAIGGYTEDQFIADMLSARSNPNEGGGEK